MTSPNQKIIFAGKSALMKELQRTIAFKAYNSILSSGITSTGKVLHKQLYDLYFGDEANEDSVGYAEQLLRGFGSFSAMFDREEELGQGEIILKLKKCFHCMEETIIVSDNPSKKGITMAVLSSKRLSNRILLNPRQLWDFAKLVERNGKKALAILKQSEYADTINNGNLPSGKSYEDYLLFLRREMYKELGGGVMEIGDDDNSTTSGTEVVEDTMKDSYLFPGYMAFALWGPIIPDDMNSCHKAEAFFISDEAKDKKNGRKYMRSNSSIDGTTRSVHSKSVNDSVMITNEIEQKAILMKAAIAQQCSSFLQATEKQNIDVELDNFKEKVQRAEREVDRLNGFMTSEILMDPTHHLFLAYQEAKNELKDAARDLDQFVASLRTQKKTNNPYRSIVDNALGVDNDNDYVTPKMKRARSETPMSSIDVELMENEDNNHHDAEE